MKRLSIFLSAFILTVILTGCESGPYVYGKHLSYWIHQLDSPNPDIRKDALAKLQNTDPRDLYAYKDRIRELATPPTAMPA